MRERPMEESIQKYTRYSNDNEVFSNDDDDEIVQVQPVKFEMFGIDPNTPPAPAQKNRNQHDSYEMTPEEEMQQ